jgi:hypothetical protein
MKKKIMTVGITFILVIISALCISGTVISQEKGKSRVKEQYYRQIEQEYIKEMRAFLTECGYKNSGVTMTYILAENGSRQYTVTIHHKKISALDEVHKQQLKQECKSVIFPVEDCSFFHEFLEADL